MQNSLFATIEKHIIQLCSYFLSLFFIIFFLRVAINKHSFDIKGAFFTLLTISTILIIQKYLNKQNIFFPQYSIFVFLTPIIILYIQYFIHGIPSYVNAPAPENILYMYNIHYAYGIIFFLIPFIIITLNYKFINFFNILIITNLIYIAFNLYYIFYLKLDRDNLNETLGFLIIYDYTSLITSSLTFIYSFYSYAQNRSKLSIFIFITSLCALYINLLHGTRGTWIALPFIFMIVLWNYRKECKLFLKLFFAQIIAGILLVIILQPQRIIERLNLAASDLQAIHQDTPQLTSIGSRLIMWDKAIENFHESPWVGISSFKVAEELYLLCKQGILGGMYITHMHNIFLQELASHGIIGLLALLFMFIFPFILLNRLYKEKNNTTLKFLYLCGIIILLNVIICGSTDFFFLTSISSSLYFLTILSILGFMSLENRK